MEAELFWDPDLADQPSFPVFVVGHAVLWGCEGFWSAEGCESGGGSGEGFWNGGRNGCACGSFCSGLSPNR